jgi:hypothetical protein
MSNGCDELRPGSAPAAPKLYESIVVDVDADDGVVEGSGGMNAAP